MKEIDQTKERIERASKAEDPRKKQIKLSSSPSSFLVEGPTDRPFGRRSSLYLERAGGHHSSMATTIAIK